MMTRVGQASGRTRSTGRAARLMRAQERLLPESRHVKVGALTIANGTLETGLGTGQTAMHEA